MATESQTIHNELKSQLLEVKRLFLNRQHKQCILRCEELLVEPSRDIYHIHTASLNFYIALSHDAVARSMHNLSASRIPTLDLAEQHYLAALTALSTRTPASPNVPESIKEDSSHSDDEGSHTSSHPRSNRSSLNSHRSSISSSSTDATSVSDDVAEPETPTKKTVRFCTSPSHIIVNDSTYSPLGHNPAACAALLSPKDRHTERYNVHLTGFVNMLHSHIASVRLLKHAPPPTPFERSSSRNSNPASRSRSNSRSLCGGKEKAGEELETIRRRRESLAPRERFNPRRYEELCRKALAEL